MINLSTVYKPLNAYVKIKIHDEILNAIYFSCMMSPLRSVILPLTVIAESQNSTVAFVIIAHHAHLIILPSYLFYIDEHVRINITESLYHFITSF